MVKHYRIVTIDVTEDVINKGRITGFRGVVVDITELKRLEEKLSTTTQHFS